MNTRLVLADLSRRTETAAIIGLLLALTAGWAQSVLPYIGPGLLVAMIFIPLLVGCDLRLLTMLLLVALLCSRLALPLGFPALVTYAHFAIFAIVVMKLLFTTTALDRVDLPIIRLTLLLAAVTVLSALIGGWHGLRPLLVWLTLAEPFVLFGIIFHQPLDIRVQLRTVLIGLGVIQLPFAVMQFLTYGPSDHVKGTLLQQGAGHHVLGTIGLTASLLLVVSGERLTPARGALAVALLSLGVLSDAKQLYGALVVGAIPLLVFVFRRRLQLLPAIAAAASVVVWLAAELSPAFKSQFTTSQLEFYAGLKFGYTGIVRDHMDALAMLTGLGPGNGSSRVAMLTYPGFGNVPELLVGTEPSSLVDALFRAHDTFWGVNLGSSVASPFYSFLGIFTDIGLLGTLVYLALGIVVWRRMILLTPLARAIGQSLLLTAVVLGIIYTWLDEPAYVAYLGAALAVLPQSAEHRPAPAPPRLGEA